MREEKPLGLNMGSASILMIFAVLCLTVFSALSLVTSISEKSTAEKFAAATAEYYAADARAEEIWLSINEAVNSGEAVPDEIGGVPIEKRNSSLGTLYSYSVVTGDGDRALVAVLLENGGSIETLQWEKKEMQEWNLDTSIEVWDIGELETGSTGE